MDNDNGNSLDEFSFDIDNMSMSSSVTIPYTWSGTTSSNITISSNAYSITGSSGAYLYTSPGANGTAWTSSNPNLTVTGDAEFDGDVKIKGRSLEKMLQKIEDRLAILQDPDPAKLEKYAALKKAYDHYKTIERLIGDD